jgi:hypothetical protein
MCYNELSQKTGGKTMFDYESAAAIVCRFDDWFNVYKRNKNGTVTFVWKFKTLPEAISFADGLKVDTF